MAKDRQEESGAAEETEQKAFSSSAPSYSPAWEQWLARGIFGVFRELPPEQRNTGKLLTKNAEQENSSWPILTTSCSITVCPAPAFIGGITWI
uniref:Mitochondrial import receptor subunit TOM22 homolog n=1 Tax=Macrostomum lignano TaxID=282301 RepID=A0A1I8FLZ0_9PLAT